MAPSRTARPATGPTRSSTGRPRGRRAPRARARGTVDRLLSTAEALVAELGIDAVSVRAITAAAGTNVASVHYHFGSKEALVDGVLARRMGELAALRAPLLDALEALDAPGGRAVVEALVLPIATFGRDHDGEGRVYVQFLAALDAAGPAWSARTAEAFAPQYRRLAGALTRALPSVPEPTLQLRLALLAPMILRTLADPDRWAATARDDAAPLTYDDLVDALVDAVTGALAAPVTTPITTSGGTR